jgi:plasmid stability protein
MPSLTLKDIPAGLLERLRARAKEERRSLSAEALTILERALTDDYRTPEERKRTRRIWAELAAEAAGLPDWDVDAIYAARTYGRVVEL